MGELGYHTRDVKMKKIYSISQGAYSDYKVLCLFTKRSKAKEFIKEWDLSGGWRSDELRIETFVLDPDTPSDIGERDTNIYEVEFCPITDAIEEVNRANYHSGKLNEIGAYIVDEHGKIPFWVYRIWVEAKNREVAMKIATEIYMRDKALMKLPDVSKAIVREVDVLDWIEKGRVKITFQK
jgi:hypothetical protein